MSHQQVSQVCRDLLQWSQNNLSLSSEVASANLPPSQLLKSPLEGRGDALTRADGICELGCSMVLRRLSSF